MPLSGKPVRAATAALCAAWLLAAAIRGAPAQATGPQLTFVPATSTVQAGTTFGIDIDVATVSNLGGYDLRLTFNPAVLRLNNLADSGFVTSGSNIVICDSPAAINNTTGTGVLSCATFTPFPPPGPGVSTTAATPMVHASFTALAAGTSTLALTLSPPPATALQKPDDTDIPGVTRGTGTVTATAAAAVLGGTDDDSVSMPISGREAVSPADDASGGLAYVFALAGAALLGIAGAWYVRVTVRPR